MEFSHQGIFLICLTHSFTIFVLNRTGKMIRQNNFTIVKSIFDITVKPFNLVTTQQ